MIEDVLEKVRLNFPNYKIEFKESTTTSGVEVYINGTLLSLTWSSPTEDYYARMFKSQSESIESDLLEILTQEIQKEITRRGL